MINTAALLYTGGFPSPLMLALQSAETFTPEKWLPVVPTVHHNHPQPFNNQIKLTHWVNLICGSQQKLSFMHKTNTSASWWRSTQSALADNIFYAKDVVQAVKTFWLNNKKIVVICSWFKVIIIQHTPYGLIGYDESKRGHPHFSWVIESAKEQPTQHQFQHGCLESDPEERFLSFKYKTMQ